MDTCYDGLLCSLHCCFGVDIDGLLALVCKLSCLASVYYFHERTVLTGAH